MYCLLVSISLQEWSQHTQTQSPILDKPNYSKNNRYPANYNQAVTPPFFLPPRVRRGVFFSRGEQNACVAALSFGVKKYIGFVEGDKK